MQIAQARPPECNPQHVGIRNLLRQVAAQAKMHLNMSRTNVFPESLRVDFTGHMLHLATRQAFTYTHSHSMQLRDDGRWSRRRGTYQGQLREERDLKLFAIARCPNNSE